MAAVVCSICRGPAVQRIAYHRDSEGDMWRVPVYLCPNPKCLEKRGAIRISTVPVGGMPTEPGAYMETPGGKTRGPNND
jgi:hypothetical protein